MPVTCSSIPTVTPGSSVVNLPLSPPGSVGSIKSGIKYQQSGRLASVSDGNSLSGVRHSRRSSKEPKLPPAQHKCSPDVIDIDESEFEGSDADEYEEEQLDDGDDSGYEDMSEPESSGESESWEEGDDAGIAGNRSDRQWAKKQHKTTRRKKVDARLKVRSPAKAAKPENVHAIKSAKIQHGTSGPTVQTPVKSCSNCSIQASSESREGDSDSTTGRDDTPELPWDLTKVRGPIRFRKIPEGHKPGTWTFSQDGVGRQSVADRSEGDIHFSPGFSGSIPRTAASFSGGLRVEAKIQETSSVLGAGPVVSGT
ncbi:hypothetical protein FRC11_011435 [Ceratobasidium sp. 423]|nr:hypothetical protein FRC11_011435 [Ceratobasidium sp. 423]